MKRLLSFSLNWRIIALIALMLGCIVCLPHRSRREVTTYTVDVKVFTDVEMFNGWVKMVNETALEKNSDTLKLMTQSKLKEYISLSFQQASTRFSTLTSYSAAAPFLVKLQLVDVSFDYNLLGTSFTIDANESLYTFRDWLSSSKESNGLFDHAMLFTSRKLTSTQILSGDIQGRAFIGRLCYTDGTSSSIIEDMGGFQSSFTMAHEVAHSLGAKHDSEENTGCSDNSFNTMSGSAPALGAVSTQWYFSSCSANSIKTYIDSIPNVAQIRQNCFTATLPPLPEFTNSLVTIPGQKFPPIEQCRLLYGRSSSVCYGGKFSQVNEICTSMWCLDPQVAGGITCKKHFAAEGTSCGNGQWCSLGSCTSNQRAPVLADCFLGDNNFIVNNLPCHQAVLNDAALCYNSDVASNCCASCGQVKTSIPGCSYGNRASNCYYDNRRCSSDTQFSYQCCATCCVDVASIDGQSCWSRVYNRQVCDNSTVARACCLTCSKVARVPIEVKTFDVNGSKSIKANYGDSVVLHCEVTGSGGTFAVLSGPELSTFKNHTLNTAVIDKPLANLNCKDSGRYFCWGQNGGGEKSLKDYVDINITCLVEPPPVYQGKQYQPQKQITVSSEKNTTFEFVVYGYPEPTSYDLRIQTKSNSYTDVNSTHYDVRYMHLEPPFGLVTLTIFDENTKETITYVLGINSEKGRVNVTVEVVKVIPKPPKDDTTTQMAIGIGVGVGGFLIIVVIVVVCTVKCRRSRTPAVTRGVPMEQLYDKAGPVYNDRHYALAYENKIANDYDLPQN